MTIKFEKEVDITGIIWYKIWTNDTCIKAFRADPIDDTKVQEDAKTFYQDVIKRVEAGYPIKVILSERTITPKP